MRREHRDPSLDPFFTAPKKEKEKRLENVATELKSAFRDDRNALRIFQHPKHYVFL